MKNLLLFFDGVALLVPEYMREGVGVHDPALIAGLEHERLLHVLEPESLMDQVAVESLATHLGEVIASGALDKLSWDRQPYEELSMSRMGFYVDDGLAGMLVEELEARSLAQASRDGLSIPLHPFVRNLVLVLLSQLLRPAGRRQGLDLAPATDLPSVHHGLGQVLGLPDLPSAAHVVDIDMQVVGVDLASVGLDEILAFREAHGTAYQAYARDVRRFMRELSGLSGDERAQARSDRSAEIAERVRELQEIASQWWRQPAGLILGLGGAAWAAATGDIFGGVLAGGAGLATASGPTPRTEAYSYLFQGSQPYLY